MRGKDERYTRNMVTIRITPAYAGKSSPPAPSPDTGGDHPRLCGEKFRIKMPSVLSDGSPPPMRGKVHSHAEGRHRIWDHPRLCGEKPGGDCFWFCCIRITPAYAGKRQMSRKVKIDQLGSPPPMRGKGFFCGGCLFEVGITPAYAGKRRTVHSKYGHNQDHPRLCGEKLTSCSVTGYRWGSPPPMRGKVPD